MRIAYLSYTPDLTSFAKPLLTRLKDRSCQVRCFAANKDLSCVIPGSLDDLDVSYAAWDRFDLKPILEFNPDVVIIWNGYSPFTIAAMRYLKSLYPMLHLERAWLPQRDFCYIADDLAPHSRFIMDRPSAEFVPSGGTKISRLKELYGPRRPPDPSLPERFIFVPAQLDRDTSITHSSPMFKTCDSFIGALLHHIPDVPIVVKNHPLEPDQTRPEGAILYRNDSYSSYDLCAQASMVVGITSTVLTEALVFGTPVASFGHNVGMPSHITYEDHGDKIFKIIRDICLRGDTPNLRSSPEETLSWLLSKQWTYRNPPDWVVDFIEDFSRKTRVPT